MLCFLLKTNSLKYTTFSYITIHFKAIQEILTRSKGGLKIRMIDYKLKMSVTIKTTNCENNLRL